MKIGILTYHRSHNYGALLQAIGLRDYLEGKGHETYFVDYWPDYHRKMYLPFASLKASGLSIRGKISGFIQDICLLPLRLRRIKAFCKFIERNICPYCRPVSEAFDCIVCGSDQIWRKQTAHDGKYNPMYFGGGDSIGRSYISYAGSMGSISVQKEDIETLKRLFANFHAISVREERLAEVLIAKGIVNEAQTVVDPTILLGADRWREMIAGSSSGVKGRYALYYKLMYDCFDDDRIREFARSHDLQLIVLEGKIRREDWINGSIIDADPLDMLRLIAGAEYVFTSSYHGLVFSLLFKRQVICAFNENKDRASSLLATLGIPERLIGKDDTIPSSSIDYNAVETKLEKLGAASRHWLDAKLYDIHKYYL